MKILLGLELALLGRDFCGALQRNLCSTAESSYRSQLQFLIATLVKQPKKPREPELSSGPEGIPGQFSSKGDKSRERERERPLYCFKLLLKSD